MSNTTNTSPSYRLGSPRGLANGSAQQKFSQSPNQSIHQQHQQQQQTQTQLTPSQIQTQGHNVYTSNQGIAGVGNNSNGRPVNNLARTLKIVRRGSPHNSRDGTPEANKQTNQNTNSSHNSRHSSQNSPFSNEIQQIGVQTTGATTQSQNVDIDVFQSQRSHSQTQLQHTTSQKRKQQKSKSN